MGKENRPDRCYFCGVLSQYNFVINTPVCGKHWHQMYNQPVPNYVDDSQILKFKRLALEKKIYDSIRNGRTIRKSSKR